MSASSFSSRRPLYARFLLTLVIVVGFGIGFLFAGGDTMILPWIQGVQAVIACDNDGSADVGETCSNCPYDVRCAAAQKCIAGACSSAGWFCKREDVCGDGWLSDFEECDDGGICTGSTNTSLNGKFCFDLDPAGDRLAGVARCRATGGICVAQDNDGCAKDCQTECHEDGAPCLLASDCCGNACLNGLCAGGGASCGNDIIEGGETCDDGNVTSGDGCSSICQVETQCNDLADNDSDTNVDCDDAQCKSTTDWVKYQITPATVRSKWHTVIDMDEDGEMDIVTGAVDYPLPPASSTIEWQKNNGANPPSFPTQAVGGTYTIAASITGDNGIYVDAGDIDGDTDIDVVGAGGTKVEWYENNGSESFTSHAIETLTNEANSVSIVDLDGDGDKDILYGDSSIAAGALDLKWADNSDGNENFIIRTIFSDGTKLLYESIPAQIDSDGRMDIFVVYGTTFTWFKNNGGTPSTFTEQVQITPMGGSPGMSYASDIDQDGDTDFLTGDGGILRWYRNSGTGVFTEFVVDGVDPGDTPRSVATGDIDEDGDIDLAFAFEFTRSGNTEVFWYENTGGNPPAFSAREFVGMTGNFVYRLIRTADLNGDGDMELVLSAQHNGSDPEGRIVWFDYVGINQCYPLDNDESS